MDVDNSDNLNDCLKNYFKKEILNGDNQIEINENNKKSYFDGTKEYKIKKLPNIMNILLKRFKFNYQNNFCVKLNNEIKFFESCEFSLFLDVDSKIEDIKNKYILFSILIHSGDYQNGHYFVIVKDFNNNRFYKIDDNKINYINRSEVLNKYCGGFFVTKEFDVNYKFENDCNVYILIYINSKKIYDYFNYKDINKYIYSIQNNIKFNVVSNKNVSIKKDNIKSKEINENSEIKKNLDKKSLIIINNNKSDDNINIKITDNFVNQNTINDKKYNINNAFLMDYSLIGQRNRLNFKKSIIKDNKLYLSPKRII